MNSPFHQSLFWLLACLFHLVFKPASGAQSCSFSSGKSYHELKIALQQPKTAAFELHYPSYQKADFGTVAQASRSPNSPLSSIFLPRWSAGDLPFFCKIEHDWSKNRARIPVKFRLGSVEYVDWLEGKGWDETRY